LNSNTHILIVDDQESICEPLCEHLNHNGFRTSSALSVEDAYAVLLDQKIDLIVFDSMMPGEDCGSMCRHVSETSKIPIILLTALTDDTDRIIGLEIGADDYVTKPFNPRELIARIRSVLRRSQITSESKEKKYSRFVHFGEWRLDNGLGELHDKNDIVIALSTGESRLLKVFLEKPNTILSRDDLLTLTQGREAFPFERSIDNMISRLRLKIEPDKAKPIYIQTVWGGGYKFNLNDSE
jgi:two-component system OmpR family response regulator